LAINVGGIRTGRSCWRTDVGRRADLGIDAADRMTERESLDVLEGYAPGGLPIVRFALAGRAVGPPILVLR
ncbi:MAG TPA: hypothetical protein VK732_01915, partial [Verrucomicrobiae bacterium]|nr:hypothetical protein [Verrucomicrobiae bacterium]